jgi:hypothetical protein
MQSKTELDEHNDSRSQSTQHIEKLERASRAPVHAELKSVCRCLSTAGLKISSNVIRMGRNLFVAVERPTISPAAKTKAHPKETVKVDDCLSLEIAAEAPPRVQDCQEVIALARSSFKKAGLKAEPFQVGNRVFVAVREKSVSTTESATQRILAAPIAASARANHKSFKHSPDYRSIFFDGKHYTSTARQAQIIQMLHIASASGTPDLSDSHILEEIESPSSRLRDSFKGSELWGTLIVSTRRGTHRLSLPIE